jgi:hypothetical protein
MRRVRRLAGVLVITMSLLVGCWAVPRTNLILMIWSEDEAAGRAMAVDLIAAVTPSP